ncbi:MAG: class I SAM-dependent methyltransferase [Candidatus Woesearchaeota archaeon]
MHNKEPQWITEAKTSYTGGVGPEYSETDFSRGRSANQVLERRILPTTEGIINILLIGVGIDGDVMYGSSEPYRISGFLEGREKDYRMTIVDKDPLVIADVQSRRKICILNSMYKTHKWYSKEWDSFLKDTGREDRLVHGLVDGLTLYEFKSKDLLSRYFKSGFRIGEIPRQFKKKLESGEVLLVTADIANVDLPDQSGFDFVSCPNVLYLLPSDGQKLAIYNIARHTKKGGLVLTNDLGYSDNPLLPRQGGWFTEDKQREIGLVVDEVLLSKDRSQELLFRKE